MAGTERRVKSISTLVRKLRPSIVFALTHAPYSSINLFICYPDIAQPDDARRLRISPAAFQALVSRYNVPTTYLESISRE